MHFVLVLLLCAFFWEGVFFFTGWMMKTISAGSSLVLFRVISRSIYDNNPWQPDLSGLIFTRICCFVLLLLALGPLVVRT